jgi:hypothetical protein
VAKLFPRHFVIDVRETLHFSRESLLLSIVTESLGKSLFWGEDEEGLEFVAAHKKAAQRSGIY